MSDRIPEIIDDALVVGEHSAIMRGDPERAGHFNRWGWTCRCGATSERKDMFLVEAGMDYRRHLEGK